LAGTLNYTLLSINVNCYKRATDVVEILTTLSFSFFGQLRLFSLGVAMLIAIVLRLLDRDASELMLLGVDQSPITEHVH